MVSGGERAVARCDLLARAPYSDMEGGLYRGWLTPAWHAATRTLADWMRDAGMSVRSDKATNVIGRYEGDRDGPALLIGSHIDSVRDAGPYDGPLGIMLGIEAVATLHAQGRRLPFPIEVVAFGDEEGSRFPAAMLTSRAMAGTLNLIPEMADAQGVTLAEALLQAGTSPDQLASARHDPPLAYLEAHIEQGPVLDGEGLPLGVVTGIAAQLRFRILLSGKAGHAGTTSMHLRRDALTAAAEIVLMAESIGGNGAEDLVATVGVLEVSPGAANVIPGHVMLTLDVRALDPVERDLAATAIITQAHQIAGQRQIGCLTEKIHDLAASPCDPLLMELLASAIAAQDQPERRLASGAGHDAMIMAALCPTAMLFIRCRDGVSHNPAEHVTPADAEAALRAMIGFIDRLGDQLDRA